MLYAIVAVTILILDQALKYWTVLHFAAPVAPGVATSSASETLIPGIIDLTRVHNYGAAWGILENARWLFILITIVFIVAVILLLKMNIVRGRFGRWTLICVLAGAVGNGIDRVIQGYVVDMFEFSFFTFPVFNIADIFITVGGILFCLYIIFHKDPLDGRKQPAETGETAARKHTAAKTEYTEPVRRERRAAPRQERPVRRDPVELPPVKPANPEDPFAEWLGPRGGTPRQAQSAPAPAADEPVVRVIESAPMPELRKKTAPEQAPAPTPQAKPAAAAKAPYAPVEEEFSLEDILNEFRDV
jgi:signal peptidase II